FNIVKDNNVLDLVKDIMNKNPVYFNEVPESIDEWFQILVNMLPEAIKTEQLLCTGSDAGCKGTDFSTVLREIFLMRVLGATNQQALAYATINPYKALGCDTRGKIVKGNIADIVILKKNPLKDISTLLNNEAVICKGQLISK
ncbi:MAG: amidohydrolase family protein, partial [Allobaculum sp.]|nr:amidohydrolase family protein [Allobaculum sp.]